MKKTTVITSLAAMLAAAACGAFEEKPWFGNQWEFRLDTAYTYSRFTSVQNALQPLKSPSNNQDLLFDLGFCPEDGLDVETEVEFAHTPRQLWARRSVGIQARFRLLDDLIGDPVSLSIGGSLRLVANNSIKDISSPYAARWNAEIHTAIGKEWSSGPSWRMRIYGLGTIGQGNRGSPWTRARLALANNEEDGKEVEIFAEGYWGFGSQQKVNINDFHGWGKIDHSSVDLGVGYHQHFPVWGTLGIDYAYRVYARSYPKAASTLTLFYKLPFSFI